MSRYLVDGTEIDEEKAPYTLKYTSAYKKEVPYERETDKQWYEVVQRDVKAGNTIFEVHAQLGPGGAFEKVADIKMLTDFTTSLFGDSRLHFQHVRVRSDKKSYADKQWKKSANFDMEEFVQDEMDEWNAGLTVPTERWPDEDDVKA